MIDSLIEVLQANNQRLESSQVKDVLLNTIKSIQFMEEKCSVCVNTRQVSLKGIFDSETLSENLNTDIFKQKKIDDNNIKNQFFTTEALNKENIDKLRVEIEELNIKIMNLELLKNTETTRSFTALDDENARLKEQNEAYIRKLDVMTALHLQEIDQINYAMQEKNNLICSLNLNIENLNATIQKMNVDLGSIPTFNLQINTYENTIKAERATLEKLKEEMFNVNHCLEECNTENFILKKEISNLKQNSLSDIQQFCNTPSTMCEFDDFDMSSFKDRPEQSKF
ncbi:uncharacterized protein LOC100212929 isoform X2 [Hydra vulgaris]|uniref:uncharacterized protein LOC100212929 isoform X2 n=1 Tax=Hydra vulgaris TaxID=6087 RepID=UPI001F5EEFB1|nr:uncharacterized protein LOC100212929 isoform X2 [Hydra vulgaris]